MEVTIQLDPAHRQLELFGPADSHLRILRKSLEVRITARQSDLIITGKDKNVNAAAEIIDRMQKHLIKKADLVIAAGLPLKEFLSPYSRSIVIIENGIEPVDGATNTGTLDSGDVPIQAVAKSLQEIELGTIPAGSLAAHDVIFILLKRIALVGGTNPANPPVVVGAEYEWKANKLGGEL